MDENVFFQHGDEPDAANFAQSLGVAATRSYTVSGFEFECTEGPNLEQCEYLHVGKGVAVIVHGDMQTASPNISPTETRRNVAHPVQKSAEANIGLQFDSVNYIWLDANIGTSDSPKIKVTQSYVRPTEYSLAIGMVDNTGTTHEAPHERLSQGWFRATGDGTFSFPNRESVDIVAHDIDNGTNAYVRSLGYSVEITGDSFNDIKTRGGTSRVVRETESVTIEEDESVVVLDWFETRGDFTVAGDMLIMNTNEEAYE